MMKVLLAIAFTFLLVACTSVRRGPVLHLPTKDSQTIVLPDGRTWGLRDSRILPNGEFFLSFTPEPRSEAKWSEMLGYRSMSHVLTLDESRSSMEKIKQFEKGFEFTIVEVGKTDYVMRISMPEHHSHVVQRVIRRSLDTFVISYEDRRDKDVGMTLKDWDAVLSSPKIEMMTSLAEK